MVFLFFRPPFGLGEAKLRKGDTTPRIFDNIGLPRRPALQQFPQVSAPAEFCIGVEHLTRALPAEAPVFP